MPEPLSQELIEKYSVSVPRYTSYPTALSFRDGITGEDWWGALSKLRRGIDEQVDKVSLYIHIPFCPSLCYFCACNKIITKNQDEIDSYLDFLFQELSFTSEKLCKPLVLSQLHLGGGSPSYLTEQQFSRVIAHIKRSFSFENDSEKSIEVDPRTVTREKLCLYQQHGFNRLSIGVQDFDPTVQQYINRHQSYELTETILIWARDLGFKGTNIDLIYGLPGQTELSFSETLEKVKRLRPSRIALYGYAHVPWVKKVQNVFKESTVPSAHKRISFFTSAVKELLSDGYLHIGMDHFALPDDELSLAANSGELQRNFMGYTVKRSEILLACGVSAISSIPSLIVQNTKSVTDYKKLIETKGSAIVKGVPRSKDDQIRGEIIHELFCVGEISTTKISERWKVDFWHYFEEAKQALSSLENDGLIQVTPHVISVTPKGKFLIRNIASEFDRYLSQKEDANASVYSKAI